MFGKSGLGRIAAAISVVFCSAAVVASNEHVGHTAASEHSQTAPSCTLTLPYAKQVLDAYEVVHEGIPQGVLASEEGVAEFSLNEAGAQTANVLAALGFTSMTEWYFCLVTLEEAYVSALTDSNSFELEGPVDETWTTADAVQFGAESKHLEIIRVLLEEERYSDILKTAIAPYE